MTTPMSEEEIMATGTFSVRKEHDGYTQDDGTLGIDPVWFKQCLRSFAAHVIEQVYRECPTCRLPRPAK